MKCFSEGLIKNSGSPRDLLNDTTSILYELTEKLSTTERNLINEIANGLRTVSFLESESESKTDANCFVNKACENKYYD
jgi:hypothetical protein